MAKPKRSNRRIWGGIIIVFGLIFSVIGGGLTYVAYDFSQRAVATSGIVIDIEINYPSSTNSGGTGGTTYKPTFGYTDQNGTPRSGQTFLSSSGYNYPVGTKLPILYDPQNPGSIRMDSWFALWGFNLVFLVLGLLIIASGATLWYFGTPSTQAPVAEPDATETALAKPDYSYSSNDSSSTRAPTVQRK